MSIPVLSPGFLFFNGESYTTTAGTVGPAGPPGSAGTVGPAGPPGSAGIPGAGLEADSIALLRTTTIPSYDEHIFVKGYYSPGDGGGGFFYWNATSVTADDGGIIIASNNSSIGRWIRIFSGSINVEWYGAKADGYTDNTSFIQIAINSLPSSGGKVYFPQNSSSYVCASSLSLAGKSYITLYGDSGMSGGASTLLFTGTGSYFINMSGAGGCSIKNISIGYNNSLFTGTVVSLISSYSDACNSCTFSDMFLAGNGTAASFFNLTNTYQIYLENIQMNGAQIGIIGVNDISSEYSNSAVISNVCFPDNSMYVSCIRNVGFAWYITGCVFGPIVNGSANAIDGGSAQFELSGCLFDDSVGGQYITLNYATIANIHGCYFGGSTTGIKFGANNIGSSIIGNRFSGMNVAIDVSSGGNIALIGLQIYDGCVTNINGTLSSGMIVGDTIKSPVSINLPGLTTSNLVATDGYNSLISLPYSISSTPNTVVLRDGYGDGYFTTVGLSALSTSGLVATDANKNLTSSISSLSPSLTGITLSGALTMNSSVTVGGSGIDGYATTLQITSGTGDALSIAAASSTGTSNGTYIQGGSTTGSSATGGTLFLNGGQSSGTSGIGGNVAINAGAGASGSSSYGHITLSSVDITASTAELLSLNASNQITSSVSGLSPGFTGLTLSGALTMNSSVTVGSSIASTAQITSGSGDALSLFPATSTGTANALYLQGGTTNASSGTGGNLFITAGAASGTTSIGGSVQIVGGSGTSYNGNISFNTVTVLTPGAANGSGNIFIGYNSTNPAHGTTTTSGVMLVVANQTTSSNNYSISSYLPKGGTTPTANTATGNLTAGWTYLLGPSGVYSVIAQG